jgi:hypothetical protein
VDDELEEIWKEAIMPYFKRHLPVGTEENHEEP